MHLGSRKKTCSQRPHWNGLLSIYYFLWPDYSLTFDFTITIYQLSNTCCLAATVLTFIVVTVNLAFQSIWLVLLISHIHVFDHANSKRFHYWQWWSCCHSLVNIFVCVIWVLPQNFDGLVNKKIPQVQCSEKISTVIIQMGSLTRPQQLYLHSCHYAISMIWHTSHFLVLLMSGQGGGGTKKASDL